VALVSVHHHIIMLDIFSRTAEQRMLRTRGNHDSSIKDASYDSCSGGGSFRERNAFGM